MGHGPSPGTAWVSEVKGVLRGGRQNDTRELLPVVPVTAAAATAAFKRVTVNG